MSRITHFELPADNPERAIGFYEKALGWRIHKWEGPMDYWLISTGDPEKPGIDGGLGKRQDESTGIEIMLDVDDLDACCKQIVAAGGSIIRERSAVPGVGWLAYFKDPEGNVLGMMENDESAR